MVHATTLTFILPHDVQLPTSAIRLLTKLITNGKWIDQRLRSPEDPASTIATLATFIPYVNAERIKACFEKGEALAPTCLTEYFVEVAPILAAGIPKLGIAPIDPMAIDSFHIEEQGQLIQAEASVSNLIVRGASNYNVQSVKFDRVKKIITTKQNFPFMHITGLYKINGTILLLPINGEGPLSINLTNVDSDLDGHFTLQDGLVIMPRVDLVFKIQVIDIALDGLLGEDAIGVAINKMLNDNAHEILNEVRPQIEDIIAKSILKNFKTAFSSVPKEILGF